MTTPKRIFQQISLLIISMISTANLYAANPCALPSSNGGIGGTGHTVEDGLGVTGHGVEDGLGGTGHGIEEGIGGTGRSVQDGIGGTGQKLAVIGVITGFASVCVNGVEIHYDDATSISINGESTTSANLMVGQLVSMTAEKTPKGWNANRISTHDAVSGPVTKVIGANRVEVAGQLVKLPNKADAAANFNLGQTLRVQGLRGVNGEIVATSVSQATARQTVISGRLDKRTNGGLGIGNMQIDGLDGQLNAGDYVSVTGELTNGRLRAAQSTRTLEVDTKAQQLSVQSAVIGVKGNVIQLSNGTQIHTSRSIKTGELVRVEAQKDKKGIWQLLDINSQTHDEIMRRAGKRQQSNEEENKKDNSGKNSPDDETKQDNSGSGSNNSGSRSGSSNSGSGSSNSQRIDIDKPSNSGSGSADRVRVESPASGGDRVRIDRPSGGDRVRVESSTSGDRVRADRPSGSGSGRGGRE